MNKNDFDFSDPKMVHVISDALQQLAVQISTAFDKDIFKPLPLPTEELAGSFKNVISVDEQTLKSLRYTVEEMGKVYQQINLEFMNSIDWKALGQTMDSFESIRQTIVTYYARDSFEQLYSCLEDIPTISERLCDTLNQVETVISQEDRQRFCLDENPLLPKIKQKTPLSLGDKIAVLGIFLNILTLLLGFLPDSQLENMQRQNEQIIENQREIIEIAEQRNLQTEQQDMQRQKSIWMLQDAIGALTQEIQSFCEQQQDTVNLPDLEHDPQQQNTLEQDGDTQNGQ